MYAIKGRKGEKRKHNKMERGKYKMAEVGTNMKQLQQIQMG